MLNKINFPFTLQHMDDGERTEFFDIVLPRMAKLALDLPSLCSQVRISSHKPGVL